MPVSISHARREVAELKARHEFDARIIEQTARLARVNALAAEHEPLEKALARAAMLVKEVRTHQPRQACAAKAVPAAATEHEMVKWKRSSQSELRKRLRRR
jgi:hypothetical protein